MRNINKSIDLADILNQHIKEQNYWLTQLAGNWEKCSFPTYSIKKISQQKEMQSLSFQVNGELFEKILKLRNGSDIRLFIILMTGLAVLLFKYTDNNDIVLGSPVLKQDQGMDVEFINTVLTLRNCITDTMTFKELLLQVKQTVAEATQHQNYPLEHLPELLNIPFPEGGDFPLFDTVVLLENIHDKAYTRAIPLNMIFSFNRNPQAITGIIEYNLNHYDQCTIERIRDHFIRMFQAIFANIDKRISDIDILSEEEKKRLLLDFNDSQINYPGNIFIHQLFEEQVEKTPGRPVLIFENEQTTYSELNKKANKVGEALVARGVKPGTLVGIMLKPSSMMIAAILGILKAGGAYLPIDPIYPPGRIAFIIQDSRLPILVSHRDAQVSNERWREGIEVVDLGEITTNGGQESNFTVSSKDSKPAYIIYTSGTTGKPKGVVVEHRQAVNTLIYRKTEYSLDEQTVSLQLFSYSFDGFVTSFFTPITAGALVVLLSNEDLLDIDKIKDAIRRYRVTHVISVPTLFQAILDVVNEEDIVSLKVVTLAGEQLLPKLVAIAKHKNKNLEIAHEYGVTEAAVMSTLYRHQEQNERIVIGRPTWNVKIYILNRERQMLPVGIPGELCIGGTGVTRGYLNNPQLNGEKFINFYHSSFINHHSRIYCTGDQARWLIDGTIEFLGRIDHQVKIWGFRIEPGEIEARLLEHGSIMRAAVVPVESPSTGERQLGAYYVTKAAVNVNEIRDFLAMRLPDYMIPAYYIPLETIPLTVSGKVDRKALPEPKVESSSETFTPPRDEIERRVAEIWAEVLGLKQELVGIDINFFEYGGYSIKATQVVNKIHQKMNVHISLAEMFKRPTIRGLSENVKKAGIVSFEILQPVEKKKYYAVSSAQKRIFILQELDLEKISYNAPIMLILEGKLDQPRFAESFNKLIARHESLRTSFHLQGEMPIQKIHDNVVFALENYLPPVKQATDRFIRPFDLGQAPLLRVGLIETGKDKYILMVDMHHIISDGASLGILVKEFIMLYNGEQLPVVKIQYKDYAEWQVGEKQTEDIKRQKTFWLKEFAGEIPVLNLPIDYARPAQQNFAGATESFYIDRDETRRLKALVSAENTTLFVVLLALFNIFLAKISRQDDIVVGTGFEARRRADLQQIIGMFVNTLPLRNFPTAEKSFKAFIGEVQENTLAAMENQEFPFEDLVEQVVMRRDKSRNPFFDVMFQLGGIGGKGIEALDTQGGNASGLVIKPYGVAGKISKFDLTLTAIERGEELLFSFEYCTKLFKKVTIELFIRYFKDIISAALEQPGQKIAKIRRITESSKQEILNSQNVELAAEILRMETSEQILQLRLREKQEQFKNRIALEFGSSHLTYGALGEQTRQVANQLLNKAIKPGTFIGVLMSHRLYLILTMLGILEARGVFVPLDPSYPPARLAEMTATTDIEMVIMDKTNFDIFGGSDMFKKRSVEAIQIEDWLADKAGEQQALLPNSEYRADDNVYIYFTSGSTGMPKAMVGKNSSLVHFIDWEIDTFGVEEHFRFGQLSAPGFDAFLRDVLVPLCSGGTICIPGNREALLEPGGFLIWLESSQVQLISCVPSVFRVLTANFLTPQHLQGLRVILFSGERITAPDLQNWLETFGGRIQLVNLWGTSETTLAKTAQFISKSDLARERVPVGKPIRGAAIMVLDENMELCAKLEIGDLYIRTPFRTYGYYNDARLNSEKFIKNPFTGDPNDLLHKTGDIGRILLEGNIDLLGRNDRQMKIRGIRVEPGEIENVLMKHPTIREAVVIKRELSGNNELLCAYVTAKEKQEIPLTDDDMFIDAIKEYAARELPSYMVPGYMAKLEKLPRNPNGKIDFQRLPDPGKRQEDRDSRFINDLERGILKIWSKIFQTEAIQVTENFFERGGNSLNVMTLIAEIHREFDVRISLGEIFNQPTIEQQAKIIMASRKDKYKIIECAEKKEYYPLSFSQRRMYFIHQQNPHGTAYNMPSVIILGKEINREKLAKTYNQLIRRHESCRTSFQMLNGQLVQKIHPHIESEIEYFEVGKEETKTAVEKVIHDFIKSFDLGKPPLTRLGIINTAQEGYLMIIDLHHIISDGRSMTIMQDEFKTLYAGEQLPGMNIQFKDYAEWENSEPVRKTIEKEEKYWLEKFADEVPVLQLPYSYPRPPLLTYEGSVISFDIGEKDIVQLKTMASEEGVSLFMLLLALYSIMLSKISSREDIVIGVPIANRGHSDLQHIVGCFVNTIAMRNKPGGEKIFKCFLKEVKEDALGAFENQDYPFELLVEKLKLKRDLSRNPIFDVQFQYAKVDSANPDDSPIYTRQYRYQVQTTKLDLILSVFEIGERINCSFNYNTNLFKEETVQRFIRYFQHTVSSVLENPGRKLSEIEIVKGEMQQQLTSLLSSKLEED